MTFYRRNLPHWHPDGKVIFLTWRLFGSLARKVLTELGGLRLELGRRFLALDRRLDFAASGPLWLADPEIAEYAEWPILNGAEIGRYKLHAYVIMPNHVHVLLEPHMPLAKITAVIKGVAARDANAALGRTGQPFWQDESFDHWARNSTQFERIRRYIEWNPVRAGLVKISKDWRWSSASPPQPCGTRNVEAAQPGMAVPQEGLDGCKRAAGNGCAARNSTWLRMDRRPQFKN